MRKLRIMIADDHAVLRIGLKMLINSQPDMELCGEAQNGAKALEIFATSSPDVALMDIRMPEMGGIQSIRELRNRYPTAKVLVFSSYANEEEIYQAVRAGARGYILKDCDRAEILASIRAVSSGELALPPAIAERLAERDPNKDLTEREIEILKLLIKGFMNKEIASILSLSQNTVKSHVKNIFSKLEVNDRAEAVSCALTRGIVSI